MAGENQQPDPAPDSFEAGMREALGMQATVRKATSDAAVEAIATQAPPPPDEEGGGPGQDEGQQEKDPGQEAGADAPPSGDGEHDDGKADAAGDVAPPAADAAPGEPDPPPDAGGDAPAGGPAGEERSGDEGRIAELEAERQQLRTELGRARAQLERQAQAPAPEADPAGAPKADGRIAKLKEKAEQYRDADPDLAQWMLDVVDAVGEDGSMPAADRQVLDEVRAREARERFETALTGRLGSDEWKAVVARPEFKAWLDAQPPQVARAWDSAGPAAAWLVRQYTPPPPGLRPRPIPRLGARTPRRRRARPPRRLRGRPVAPGRTHRARSPMRTASMRPSPASAIPPAASMRSRWSAMRATRGPTDMNEVHTHEHLWRHR